MHSKKANFRSEEMFVKKKIEDMNFEELSKNSLPANFFENVSTPDWLTPQKTKSSSKIETEVPVYSYTPGKLQKFNKWKSSRKMEKDEEVPRKKDTIDSNTIPDTFLDILKTKKKTKADETVEQYIEKLRKLQKGLKVDKVQYPKKETKKNNDINQRVSFQETKEVERKSFLNTLQKSNQSFLNRLKSLNSEVKGLDLPKENNSREKKKMLDVSKEIEDEEELRTTVKTTILKKKRRKRRFSERRKNEHSLLEDFSSLFEKLMDNYDSISFQIDSSKEEKQSEKRETLKKKQSLYHAVFDKAVKEIKSRYNPKSGSKKRKYILNKINENQFTMEEMD